VLFGGDRDKGRGRDGDGDRDRDGEAIMLFSRIWS